MTGDDRRWGINFFEVQFSQKLQGNRRVRRPRHCYIALCVCSECSSNNKKTEECVFSLPFFPSPWWSSCWIKSRHTLLAKPVTGRKKRGDDSISVRFSFSTTEPAKSYGGDGVVVVYIILKPLVNIYIFIIFHVFACDQSKTYRLPPSSFHFYPSLSALRTDTRRLLKLENKSDEKAYIIWNNSCDERMYGI